MDNPVRNLRCGLFGAGPWAEHAHAPALAAHGGVDFAGVWARRPEAAAALARAHGTEAYSGDEGIDALLAECEAAAFALPPDVQAPLAARAAEAGRHLILDKPVATSVAAARETAEAAARAGVASVVFCTPRFDPDTAIWIAEQSAAGGWFTASAVWLGSRNTPGEDVRYPPSPWRREKGGLWDVGPHVLSVLIPFLGEVTEVRAIPGARDTGTVHLVLQHASGGSSTATIGLGAPRRAAGVSVEFAGERGRAVLPKGSDAVNALRQAVDELRQAIRSGEPNACDARFGVRLTEILAEAESQLP
ncbi:Gfo/Idh/MocA family oxidoreductase [Streptomyces sp. NPDC001889]